MEVMLLPHGDDWYLPLPPEILDANGWKRGDVLMYVQTDDRILLQAIRDTGAPSETNSFQATIVSLPEIQQ